MIFVYREKSSDRDACAYFNDDIQIGKKGITGPCFWKDFGMRGFSRDNNVLAYDEVETILSEEEYQKILDDGVTPEILDKLTSLDALAFEDQIMADEFNIIQDELNISYDDTVALLDEYPYGYRDRGIVSLVYRDWEDVAENEAYELGYTSGELGDRYFNYDALIDDLQMSDRYCELPSGKVVSFNM